jgi:type I restriction enzyme M protein
MSTPKIDALWDDNPVNVSAEVNFIWSIANKLRGAYQSDKYKDVIIPMTIIRRFECALAPTKTKVVKKFKENPTYPAKAMCKIAGYQFYNTSEFTLAELINDSDHLASNFKSYLNGFSDNVKSIIANLDFDKQIDKMNKHNRLLTVVKAFSEIDLDPAKVDNIKMGYIFEELIRKFSENAEAGDHYTGRDIIKLMVSILLAEGCDDIFEEGKVITIGDQASGTGGMLSTANNYIKRFNESADIRLFSQEVNPESYAMCLAEMLIRGQNAENIRLQDTMKADCFPSQKMRFVIENPPFGQPWGGKDAAEGVEDAVNAEALKKEKGRFPAGKPATGDMQLLFVQSAINKLEDNGRAAIIENGSPLFSGGVSSGESQIRRWLLDNDYLEAIIQLSGDMFYNTGIATYIWVISKKKRKERIGKIQLIDASSFSHPLRKSLGSKRNEITPEDRAAVTKLYAGFKENEFSKIFRNSDFKYREYTVMQPLQRSYGITKERIENMVASGTLGGLYDEATVTELENAEELTAKEKAKLGEMQTNKPIYDTLVADLYKNISPKIYKNPKDFIPVLTKILDGLVPPWMGYPKFVDKIAKGLSVIDKTADIQKDKNGNVIYDADTKDAEIVPFNTDIKDYMAKEVLPHIPDAKAFFEENLGAKKPVVKTGAEIPFTKMFYKYKEPRLSKVIAKEIVKKEAALNSTLEKLFG